MKKAKIVIMVAAIVLSIGGAFTNKHFDCTNAPQYYYNGFMYLPAGQLGVQYVCESSGATCTYYQIGQNYAACQFGSYTPIPQGLQNKQ